MMKEFGTPSPPPFQRKPPFQLNPCLWAIFSWPPSLSEFQKQETPLIFFFFGGGEETMNLTPFHDISNTSENIINSRYHDINQLPTLKEFTDKSFLSLSSEDMISLKTSTILNIYSINKDWLWYHGYFRV